MGLHGDSEPLDVGILGEQRPRETWSNSRIHLTPLQRISI
jgi:hypothetical protein